MKYFYLFIFFLLVSLSSFAQSNYKPGYVVDLKNDTLKGFIGYKEWENNPKEFTFKSNLNQSSPQKFSLGNSNAFGVIGIEDFRKFVFSKSNSATDINKLEVGIDTSRTVDTAFLKVIVKGKNVSLYSFTDNIKTRFYTTTNKDREPQELDYYVFHQIYNNANTLTVYTFRDQIKNIASNYDTNNIKLANKIKYAYYREGDLKTIVELINGEGSQSTQQSSVSAVRYFVGAAARFSKLETGGGQTFFPDGTNASSTSPVLSGGINIYTNKYTQKFIFRTEINLAHNHYYIPPTAINGGGTTATIDFKQFTASVAPQIIYNVFSTREFKFFIDGGVAINFYSYNKYDYVMNFNNVSTISKHNFPGFEKNSFAFITKAGFVIYNKIELYASRAFSSPLSQASGATATISYYQAGLNYLF